MNARIVTLGLLAVTGFVLICVSEIFAPEEVEFGGVPAVFSSTSPFFPGLGYTVMSADGRSVTIPSGTPCLVVGRYKDFLTIVEVNGRRYEADSRCVTIR